MRIGRRGLVVALVALMPSALLVAAPERVEGQPAPVATPAAAPVGNAPTPAGSPSRVTRELQRQVPDIDLDHLVVRFRSQPADLLSRLAFAGAHITRAITGTRWTELATPNRSARRVRAALRHDRSIAQVGYSYIRHASTVPDDPIYATKQAGYLAPLRLDRAWDISQGAGVVVAVVDTGVDLDHPDLAGRLVSGRNVLNPGAAPQDDAGHGTLVAGVVAARTNNNRGVVGVAPGARVMPVKVLDQNGSGSDADIALGVDWARTHGAKVINLSLGGTFDDPLLSDAVAAAVAANIVVVAAAGNDGADIVSYPAAYPGVVSVSATDNAGALTSFSSFGWSVDVAAPGLNITSTALGSSEKYATESGTSFSSPIVAGEAALIRAAHPGWGQAHVADQIRDTARDVGLPGVDPAFGHGIVDPLAALGGPPLAPHPAARVGADEPNDTPADATPLVVNSTKSAQIAPETDADWYGVHFASTGWYSIHVPSSAASFVHEMDPLVELYNPDVTFAASQEFLGGDLVFQITATGDYFVRVRNLNGGTASYSIIVKPTATPARFASALEIDFGTAAASVGIADVNGDGRNDTLVAFGDNSDIPDTLAVFAQTPTRTLSLLAALPTDVMTGGGMATGDLDGDGHSDVAIPVSGGIDYFTTIGSTSTPTPTFIPSADPNATTTSVTIADVDGDTHNDVVAVGSFGATVYWGPDFLPGDATVVTATAATRATVAAGNVTGHLNGRLDIVMCCTKVYAQIGPRGFGSATTHTISKAADVATGDVNDDGATDVVASIRSTSGSVVRLVQDGGGALVAASLLATRPGPEPIATADIDNDSLDDILVLHDFVPSGSFLPASVGLLRQGSPGSFNVEQAFTVDDFNQSYDAKALAVGDVEGDGRADALVATSYGIAVLVQNSGVLPSLGAAWITDAQPSSLATNVVAGVVPTVTLGRDATNVDDTTVHLQDAVGNDVAATVSYDGPTKVITVTPTAPLPDGRYAVHLAGLTDTDGDTLADAGTTFSVGAPPDEVAPQTTLHSPPSGFRTTSKATLSFTSNESGSVFWCSDNNQPYHTCTSPKRVSATAMQEHSFRVFARDAAGNEDPSPALAKWTYRPAVHGYWMLGGKGAIYPFGNAPGLGNAATSHAVDFDVSPSGYGYWIVDAAGRVVAFGDAKSHGNAPALAAGDSVTSLSRTASGNGYWLFTGRGRVYSFGDAHFYGDLRNVPLNGGVVDSIRTPNGHGYYMVATDGGVFSFGNAAFHGSTGNMKLKAPVRSLVPDPDGSGYWLVAVDGGVFAFAAPFRGSMGSAHLNRPIVGMVAFGNGYLMVGADGGIFNFSNKAFLGSLGGHPPAVPIVAVAVFG